MRRLFGQMIKRPVDALVSSIEMVGQSMKGSHRIDAIASRIAHTLSRASGGVRNNQARTLVAGSTDLESAPLTFQDENNSTEAAAGDLSSATENGDDLKTQASPIVGENRKAELDESIDEQKKFSGIDLRGDMLKLVQYRVLFVRRDYEVAFPEKEELIADSIDETTFTSWKIAEFIQSLGQGEMEPPGRWRHRNCPSGWTIKEGKLVGLRDEDKKYLRVHYEVLDRFPRKSFGFKGKQIRRLEEIRDALQNESRSVSD
jgi:hypothetical protein